MRHTTLPRRSATPARPTVVCAVAAGLVVALTGCGSDEPPAASSDAGDTAGASEAGSPEQADSLTVDEPWVQATDEGMTAAFGLLTNDGTEDVRIVSAESPVTGRIELHEVVMVDGSMKMQEKGAGFVIPAGEEHVLEPGADHLMLMDVTTPILPGEDVEFVLTVDDGSTFTFEAQAKEFAGGDEEYVPGSHDDMDHDDAGHNNADHGDADERHDDMGHSDENGGADE